MKGGLDSGAKQKRICPLLCSQWERCAFGVAGCNRTPVSASQVTAAVQTGAAELKKLLICKALSKHMYECVREIVCVLGGESHFHSVNINLRAASNNYFLY